MADTSYPAALNLDCVSGRVGGVQCIRINCRRNCTPVDEDDASGVSFIALGVELSNGVVERASACDVLDGFNVEFNDALACFVTAVTIVSAGGLGIEGDFNVIDARDGGDVVLNRRSVGASFCGTPVIGAE